MELKDKLIQLRKDKRMTQADLAEALNISRQAVSRWETGVALPSTENLIELSKLYGVSVDVILRENVDLDQSTKREEGEQRCILRSNKKLNTIIVVAIAVIVCAVAIAVGEIIKQHEVQFEDMIEEFDPNFSEVDIIPIP